MTGWDDVRRLALDLPGVVEQAGDTTSWRVGGKAFAWERFLRRGELELAHWPAPDRPALGLRVPDVGVRDAWIAGHPGVFFLVPHYQPYPMVLVRVESAPVEVLDDAVTEAWMSRAARRRVDEFLRSINPQGPP